MALVAGGGPIASHGSVASQDGRLIAVPSANTVRLYSAVTGDLVGLLTGHTGEVTGLQLDPQEPGQVRTQCVLRNASASRSPRCMQVASPLPQVAERQRPC